MEVLPALKRVFLQPRITVEGSLGTRADNTWSAMNDHLAPTGREEDIRGLFSKANAQLGLYFWVHPRWSVGVEGFTQQQFHTSASYGPFELSILEALTLDVRHVFGQVSYSLVPYDRFLRRTLEVQTGIGAGVAYGRTNIILRRTGTSVDDVARNENLFTTLATKGHVTVSWFLWPQVAFTGRMDVGWSPPVGFDTVTMPVSGANQEEIVLEGGAIPIHFSQWSLGLRYHLW
ncbi:MAG TPA: hypothetical protein DCR93_31130 [Cytophagales bacterium]|nr:hypothetical protein [Cytophagales bacterium]